MWCGCSRLLPGDATKHITFQLKLLVLAQPCRENECHNCVYFESLLLSRFKLMMAMKASWGTFTLPMDFIAY